MKLHSLDPDLKDRDFGRKLAESLMDIEELMRAGSVIPMGFHGQPGLRFVGPYANGGLYSLDGRAGWGLSADKFRVRSFANDGGAVLEVGPSTVMESGEPGRVSVFETDPTETENIAKLDLFSDLSTFTIRSYALGNATFRELVLGIYGAVASTSMEHIRLRNGEVVINEQGDVVSFRVEGDTNENALMVNANTDSVGIRTGGPTSALDVNGSFGTIQTAFSSSDTLTIAHSVANVDATAGVVTMTLPPAAGITGRIYEIKKNDSSVNRVIVDGSGSETIDGSTTYSLYFQYESIKIQSDGTNWIILGKVKRKDLFCGTADKTVANTTSETTLVPTGQGTVTIPANFWAIGKTVRVCGKGYFTENNPSNYTINAKLGGTTGATTGAVALAGAHTNEGFDFEIDYTCRTTGATGTVYVQGRGLNGTAGQKFIVGTSTITVDTTGPLAIDVTWTWSVADANNTITLTHLTAEVIMPETD